MTIDTIHFIKMGGTIEFFDPAYDAINKKLMKLDTTIDSYLTNLIKPHFEFSSETLAEKDSRDISDEDRAILADHITASPHNNIVITHGTFTMVETAVYLGEYFKAHPDLLGLKKIMLTGSMIPITGFSMSDAGFNLGFTIASFAAAEPGVYVCMNGRVFLPGEASKNEALFRFE